MSLKAVHLVFVTVLTALTLGCAIWFLTDYRSPDGTQLDLILGCVSVAAFVAVPIYGWYFLKKLKNVSFL